MAVHHLGNGIDPLCMCAGTLSDSDSLSLTHSLNTNQPSSSRGEQVGYYTTPLPPRHSIPARTQSWGWLSFFVRVHPLYLVTCHHELPRGCEGATKREEAERPSPRSPCALCRTASPQLLLFDVKLIGRFIQLILVFRCGPNAKRQEIETPTGQD